MAKFEPNLLRAKHEAKWKRDEAASIQMAVSYLNPNCSLERDRSLRPDRRELLMQQYWQARNDKAISIFYLPVLTFAYGLARLPVPIKRCRRRSLSRNRRYNSLLRQQFLGRPCQHCGSWDNLEVSHTMPVALGGSDEVGNLEWLCHLCHQRKDPWTRILDSSGHFAGIKGIVALQTRMEF